MPDKWLEFGYRTCRHYDSGAQLMPPAIVGFYYKCEFTPPLLRRASRLETHD
jgi:hypothetical protein